MVGVVSTEDGMTKVVMDNGDIFYYLPNDIKDISLVEKSKAERKSEKLALKQEKKEMRIQNRAARTKGYFGTVGVSSTLGSTTLRLTTIHGYFNKGFHIGVGVGVGIASFDYVDGDQNWRKVFSADYLSIPVFLHISQELTKTKVAPFIGVNAGYDLGGDMIIYNNLSYLMMVQPLAGLNIKLKKSSLRISGGYDLNYGPVVNFAVKF